MSHGPLTRAFRVGVAGLVLLAVVVQLRRRALTAVTDGIDRRSTKRWWMSPEPGRHVTGRLARIARWVPGATCLARSLSARLLLGWQGQNARIRYGANTDLGTLRAHAWVEVDGVPAEDVPPEFTPFGRTWA